MPAPALSIPINVNLDQLKEGLKQTSSLTQSATRQIAKQFLDMNKEISDGLMAGAARMGLRYVGSIALVVGSLKLMSEAISGARDQMKEMVAIADKSQSFGVSPAYLQAFSAETRKLKVEAGELESALSHAFNATKDKSPIDIGEWTVGEEKITDVEKALRVYKTSADSMLATIGEVSSKSDGVFPNVLVQRAKEMDDQLKLAHQRLSTALKPSWDDLASVLLTIKGYWSDTVDLIAKAVEFSNKVKIPGFTGDNDLAAKRDALGTVNGKLAGNWGMYGMFASRETLEGHRDRLQKEIAALAQGEQYGPPVPGTSRGTGIAPTRKPTGNTTDKLETSADAIEKRTAALQAEAAAIDDGTAARERSKVIAQLETVAKQANAAAGKGENVVTEEQRARINEVADAYSKAAESMQKARIASDIKFGRRTALLDPNDVAIAQQLRDVYPNVAQALNSVEAQAMRTNEAMRGISGTASTALTSGLTDILSGTKSVSQGFSDMSRAIVRALEEALIKMLIVQPIMRSLSAGFGFSDGGFVGALPRPGDAAFIGPVLKADGGLITGPGTGRSDSIPAYLSNGEFVVNASATARNRSLLEAINSKVPRFADGGFVGAGAPPMIEGAGQVVNVAPHIAVTVQGSPGMSSADHKRMGETIGQQLEPAIRALIGKELRIQRRPGGILR